MPLAISAIPCNLKIERIIPGNCSYCGNYRLATGHSQIHQVAQNQSFRKCRGSFGYSNLFSPSSKHHRTTVMAAETSSEQEVIQSIPKLMIVSDLDNTMVDHQDPEHKSLLSFNAKWKAEYAKDSLLVFSTGRSPTAFKELKSHVPLLTPDITILSVGTEILYGDDLIPDSGWEAILDQGWDRQAVVEEATKFSGLRWQRESEQRPHKVSFNIEKAEAGGIIEPLKQQLESRGLKVKIIYSGGYDLDLLPEAAGKGRALAYLLKKLKSENRLPRNTLACGDSGNDQELFAVDGANGVIVGNAMEELVQWYESQNDTKHLFRATERCASGILQAMSHFKF